MFSGRRDENRGELAQSKRQKAPVPLRNSKAEALGIFGRGN